VNILRRFRDDSLMRTAAGRRFVAWYYRHSPTVAAAIAGSEWQRALVRGLLKPLIWALDGLVSPAGASEDLEGEAAPEYLVKFRPGVSPAEAEALVTRHGGEVLRLSAGTGIYVVRQTAPSDAPVPSLSADPRVEFVEPQRGVSKPELPGR
jgi:hypothetical protein